MARHLEKRHNARNRYKAFITIKDMQIGGIELAKMINCGENGLYFESDRILQPGAEIFIWIENSPYACPATSGSYRAKILWRKRIKNSIYSFGYGVKYIHDKIEQYSSKIDLKETKDFRKHPRRQFIQQTFFRSQNKFYKGTISNVSRGGCFIETSENFNLKQIISLIVLETKNFKNIMIKAQVARLSPIGIGVKFRTLYRQKS